MKALREAKELLVDVKIDVEQFGYIETKLEVIIAQLEALQQFKSCDGCKFHDDVGWDDWCCDCIRKWTIDRYEAKEQ